LWIGKWREKEQSYRALSIEHARKHAKTNKPPISDGSSRGRETKDKGKEKPKLHKASGYAERATTSLSTLGLNQPPNPKWGSF